MVILPEVVDGSIWRLLENVGWTEGESPSTYLTQAVDQFAYDTEPIIVRINNQKAVDKTNYRQVEQDPLDAFYLTGEYQFYLHHDSIYTNFDFASNPETNISVTYRYLTQGIKLRTDLFTNRANIHGATPAVRKFRLKMRSRQ
jgi:hypothetical protein